MPERDYDETVALYEKYVAELEGVERKGKSMPYTSMNGNMFTFVTKEGRVALRLSEEDREAFVAKYDAGPCVQYGKVMNGYVEVPDEVLGNTRAMKKYFAASHAYAGTLKAKPTTRPKKKAPAKKKAATKKTGATKSPGAKAKKKASKKKPTAKKKGRSKK